MSVLGAAIYTSEEVEALESQLLVEYQRSHWFRFRLGELEEGHTRLVVKVGRISRNGSVVPSWNDPNGIIGFSGGVAGWISLASFTDPTGLVHEPAAVLASNGLLLPGMRDTIYFVFDPPAANLSFGTGEVTLTVKGRTQDGTEFEASRSENVALESPGPSADSDLTADVAPALVGIGVPTPITIDPEGMREGASPNAQLTLAGLTEVDPDSFSAVTTFGSRAYEATLLLQNLGNVDIECLPEYPTVVFETLSGHGLNWARVVDGCETIAPGESREMLVGVVTQMVFSMDSHLDGFRTESSDGPALLGINLSPLCHCVADANHPFLFAEAAGPYILYDLAQPSP
jgi:hypothetical protein